jgi:hypothetical protein
VLNRTVGHEDFGGVKGLLILTITTGFDPKVKPPIVGVHNAPVSSVFVFHDSYYLIILYYNHIKHYKLIFSIFHFYPFIHLFIYLSPPPLYFPFPTYPKKESQ